MTEQYFKVLLIMTMLAICMSLSAIDRIAMLSFSTGFKQTAIQFDVTSGEKRTFNF